MDGLLAHLLNFPLLLIFDYINFTKEYQYFLPCDHGKFNTSTQCREICISLHVYKDRDLLDCL